MNLSGVATVNVTSLLSQTYHLHFRFNESLTINKFLCWGYQILCITYNSFTIIPLIKILHAKTDFR